MIESKWQPTTQGWLVRQAKGAKGDQWATFYQFAKGLYRHRQARGQEQWW